MSLLVRLVLKRGYVLYGRERAFPPAGPLDPLGRRKPRSKVSG